MQSLDVLKSIILNLKLYEGNFLMVRHRSSKNWRQINDSNVSKINNLEQGLIFENYDTIAIKGKEILNLSSKKISDLATDESPLISIASIVELNDTIFHIPLMNLHLDEQIELSVLVEIINKFTKNKFWIMKTDRYFHIYVNDMLGSIEWLEWNLRYLMSSFLVSPRYIAQSLQRNYNLLRLNATDNYKVIVPYCIYEKGEL